MPHCGSHSPRDFVAIRVPFVGADYHLSSALTLFFVLPFAVVYLG